MSARTHRHWPWYCYDDISEVTRTACCRITVGSSPLSVVRVQLRDDVRWVSDVGSLLTDAGFKLVTADTDIVHVNFRDAAHAMETLQVCYGDF